MLLNQEERIVEKEVIVEKEILVPVETKPEVTKLQEEILQDTVALKESAIAKNETGPEEDANSEREIRKAYEELKRVFENQFEKFAYEDLRLMDSEISFYQDLKSQREKELLDYLTPKIEENVQNNGEYYIYSSEDMIFVGKLNEKYHALLKESWGLDAFSRFQKFLKEYNDIQQHRSMDGKVSYIIDF